MEVTVAQGRCRDRADDPREIDDDRARGVDRCRVQRGAAAAAFTDLLDAIRDVRVPGREHGSRAVETRRETVQFYRMQRGDRGAEIGEEPLASDRSVGD